MCPFLTLCLTPPCSSHFFGWGDFTGEVWARWPFDSPDFPSFSFGKNSFSAPYFLFIASCSSGPAPSMPPPGAVKVQLLLSALYYPARGAGQGQRRKGVGKKERKVRDDILAFLGSCGCSCELLEQVSPCFFSALLSYTSSWKGFKKCQKGVLHNHCERKLWKKQALCSRG